MKPHGGVVDALGDAFGFAVAEAVFDHGVAVGGAVFLDAEADEEGGEAGDCRDVATRR